MKTSSLFGIIFGAVLLLASCDEDKVKMHTIIYEDGHCKREVSYGTNMPDTTELDAASLWEVDSVGEGETISESLDTNVLKPEVISGIDTPEVSSGIDDPDNDSTSQWQGDSVVDYPSFPECLDTTVFKRTRTKVDGDSVTTISIQEFESVEEMCRQTPLLINGSRLQSNAKLEKRFRWFYTEYTFTEVFKCIGNAFKLPVANYADKDVANYWFTGQPNLVKGLSGAETSQKLSKMEALFTNWLNDNLYQVFFDVIVSNYDSIPNPPVSRERFIELHDSLKNYLLKGQENFITVHVEEALQSFFHSNAYAMCFDEKRPCGKVMNEEIYNCMSVFSFNVPYALTMPGKVVDAGTGVCRNGTIFYPLTGERLIPQDYTITATSRVINIWAFIVTLLIVVLAIGSWFRRK